MKRFIKADSGKFGSENQIKFFYKRKFLGSCDPDYIECPELLNLLKSDKTAATQVLNYLNSMGDPVFPVSEEKWSTPETNIDNIDIDDLYATFMQELDYEYADMQAAGFGFDVYSSAPGGWDFEIFDGPTVDDVESSTKIKASRYDNVPGYKAPESGYLYIFKHGIGPGTLPSDVEIIKTKDLPNGYTAVWLSDFLTTDELKKYDIPDETRINSILDRIGYCQKNGDVVPCDDSNTWEGYSLDACDDIMAATDSNRYTIKSVSDEGTFYLVKDWRKNRELWVSKDRMDSHPEWWFTSPGKAKQSLKSLLSVMDEYLSDTFTVVDMSGNETPLDVKDLGFTHIPIYDNADIDACVNGATEPNSPDADKTKLVRQVIKQAKKIRDYFQSHNNNLNRKQEQYLEDLSDGIDNESVVAIRDAIENLKYNSKNLRSEQYNLIMDLYDEFNLAGGKFEGMGYPEDAGVEACSSVTASTSPEDLGLEPRQRTAADGKTWWVVYDTVTHKYLDTIMYFGKYKTKKECQYAIDRAIDQYGDDLNRTIRNHRKYFSTSGVDNKVTGSTKYMANMVSASDDGYEQLAEGNDSESEEYIEYGKYYVAGYLQNSYRGLMEDLYSDDFEEILASAADMAGQGLYVEITNRVDGRSKRYTPDDFEDAASYGEYPDHIREDLAL